MTINIDNIIEALNDYLLTLYPTRDPEDFLVMQAYYDGNRLKEPYASVDRGVDRKASYQRSRQVREDDPLGIKLTFERNDDFDLDFQSYDQDTEKSKTLMEQIYNWFQFIAEVSIGITVRQMTDISPSRFVIAKETVNTFLFSVTIGTESKIETIEERVEGVEIVVN